MCSGMVQNNPEGGDKKLLFVRLDFRARKSKVCCKMLAPLESSAFVDFETPSHLMIACLVAELRPVEKVVSIGKQPF